MASVAESDNSSAANLDAPIDLTMKPTPPMPNISVVKVGDDDDKESRLLDYRPKNTSLSRQQERDYEDTIDSVIGKGTDDPGFEPRETAPRDHSSSVVREKKSNKDEWRVSHISETYDGDDNDDNNDDNHDDRDKDDDGFQRPVSGLPFPYTKPPAAIAPHLKFLYDSPKTTVSPIPRPRGRPRGSGSGFYKNAAQRSPMGGRRGRPPLHRGSPGRPPLSSVGRPSLNRSPGRPPLNRSPGRPPLNRSPGRPSTGRSPGRPKGSGLSPRPRGRPRGSKSPRSRGASPRGGSPRAAIAQLTFDEDEANDSSDSKKTNVFKLENDDSEATLFEFPSKSSPSRERRKEKSKSPTPVRPTSPTPDLERSLSIPSPAPTEPAGSSESRDASPVMSPTSDHSLPGGKREPSSERVSDIQSEPALIEKSYLARELIKDIKPLESPEKTPEKITSQVDKVIEKLQRESSERERSDKESSWERERERDRSHREHKEHSKERDREKDRDRDRDRDRDKDRDRDRERSKEHRKDKKKKKKKNKDRDKERERERDRDKDREKDRDKDRDRTEDRERKDRHKEKKEERREREKEKEKESKKEVKKEIKKEKETREESPSVQPLQKLKIKFGGGSSSSPSLFSISTSQTPSSPKPDTSSPAPAPAIPKLKFKMLPPKPDRSAESDQSWVSTIKTEPLDSDSTSRSPSRLDIDSDSDNASSDRDSKSSTAVDDEVTVSVVKGKIIVKKPAKRSKRKGSGKKGRPKGEGHRKEGLGLFGDSAEGPLAALKKEVDKEPSPISPPFSPQNVPSPITIPALKAAPPPPSPPTAAASKKISPPKARPSLKDVKPESPLLKDITKSRDSPVPKPSSKLAKPSKKSPKKSSKVSPTFTKSKGSMSPPSKQFPFMEFQSPKTPSPRRSSSPSQSAPSSPMYSPPSSPDRTSPLSFQIPTSAPTFTSSSPPRRSHSPISRQPSTDDDDTDLTPTSVDRPTTVSTETLPPMPPTSAQKRAQRTVITETVGSFFNEVGEKIWICPACTMQDDGSPMIGCDICDDWYHWVCVGIKVEPSEDEQWYCQKCKPNGSKGKPSKRGRKKRKS